MSPNAKNINSPSSESRIVPGFGGVVRVTSDVHRRVSEVATSRSPTAYWMEVPYGRSVMMAE